VDHHGDDGDDDDLLSTVVTSGGRALGCGSGTCSDNNGDEDKSIKIRILLYSR
jgi:hypothetical protein